MATVTILEAAGLHTSGNQLAAPKGAVVVAQNCVAQRKNRYESRRGQAFASYGVGASSDRVNELFFFAGRLIEQYGSKLAHDIGSAMLDFSGTFASPSPSTTRMKAILANQGLLFTSQAGPQYMPTIGQGPGPAGVPRATDIGGQALVPHLTGNVGAGWLPPNNQVSYRCCFGIRDGNGNTKLGSPSGRVFVVNPKDIAFPIGTLVQNHANTLVTATFAAGHTWPVGSYYTAQAQLSPGEANFPVGPYNVTAISTTQLTWSNASVADAASTAIETLTTGSQNTVVTFGVPPGVTTAHFVRIFRSNESGDATVPPSDEMFEVVELPVTSGMISAGFFNYTDVTPDTFLGGPLYTNPQTGVGLDQANERPPFCLDIASWNGRAWYAQTQDRQRFFLSILGTGSGTGIQVNDTVTIAGVAYKAVATVVLATDFLIYTTGTPAQNIEWTARSLCETVNTNPGATVVGYYVSSVAEAPGKMMFESVGVGVAAFTVYASRVGSWFPGLTNSSTNALASDNSARTNGISYSVLNQPEAVPSENFLFIGEPKQDTTLRALKLRDKLFAFNQLTGIYTVSGQFPFLVESLDATTLLIAPDTLVSCGNQLFGLTNQGVVAVSDAGVRIVSKDKIETDLKALIGATLPQIQLYAFGVAYESDHEYWLFLPTLASDTSCTQAYVYNFLTDGWTGPSPLARTCGRVNPYVDQLYMGDANSNVHRIERKKFDRTDFADEGITPTLVVASGNQVVLASVSGFAVGDMLLDLNDSIGSTIVAINVSTNTLTTNDSKVWSSSLQVLKAIPCKVKYAPQHCGKPSWVKAFRDVSFHFNELACLKLQGFTDSDNVAVEEPVVLQQPGLGTIPFGGGQFGEPGANQPRRMNVPQDHARATNLRVGISIAEARAVWILDGYSIEYEDVSERSGM